MNNFRIRLFKGSDCSIWDDFISKSINCNFLYSRRFLSYHRAKFVDASIIIENNNSELIAVMPAAIIGNCLNSHPGSTYGGILTKERLSQNNWFRLIEEISNFAKNELQCAQIMYKYRPNIYNYEPYENEYMSLINIKNVEINTDFNSYIDYNYRCKMSKGRRHAISKAKKSNLSVIEGNLNEEFWETMSELLFQRHGVQPVHTFEEISLLKKLFPDNIQCLSIYRGSILLGGVVMFVFPYVAHCQYIFTTEDGKLFGAIDFLLAELIDRFSDSKRYFSFGTSSSGGQSELNHGLLRQKEGFGAGTGSVHKFTWKL